MASDAVTRFLEHADRLGVTADIREFPAGTRTAQEAADAIGCEVAQIVKSLVFIAGEQPVLALTSGRNRVDERKLATVLGVDVVRKADADEVRQATGYAIGGTPPFGHATDLEVVCDRDLTGFDEVWAAAGTPATVFPLSPDRLLAATGARVVDLAA